VVVRGSTISLANDATAVAINGVTQFVAIEAPTRPPALLTFKGKTYTGSSARNALYTLPTYVIAGSTLTPGGEITVDGTPVALASDASAVIYNGKTRTISQNPASASAVTTNPPILTIGGKTYTADKGTTYDVNGQTLAPGSAISVGGTKYSLAPSGTALVAGGKTKTLFPATKGHKAVSTNNHAKTQTQTTTTKTQKGSPNKTSGNGATSTTSGVGIPGLSAAEGLELAGPLALVAAILGL
jgi:hypothetical protein